MTKLTEKQKRFADKYIELGNGTKAAIEAGYSKKTARVIGQENLLKPAIKAYIDTRLAEMDEKRVMKADEALELLTKIARGELGDSVVVSGGWGYEIIEKPPDINQRKDAAKEILKRYPMNRTDELKERLLEAQVSKTHAETARIERDSSEGEDDIIDDWISAVTDDE